MFLHPDSPPELIPAAARRPGTLLETGALHTAIFNSANFSCIPTDAKGVIHLFNVGAERMLGCTAAGAIDTLTPADGRGQIRR